MDDTYPKTHSDYVLEWGRRGDKIAELKDTNARMRELLLRLRPKTLVLCRDTFHGNSMEPTSTTREIDALLANNPS